ncbi:MAG TPA: shikimate kinase [Rugosimonospora sp.]|jgi:shikimate kinase|nr:shikimate kinase [Rugosimonospora sp.]
MGSGKTTVGVSLARQLGWRFEDLDTRIEDSAGFSISAIFERRGEAAFREIEREQLEKALGRVAESGEPIVLALGGGTYAQPGIMERLRGFGAVVIWLDCPANLLLARCATMNNRPLFRDEASFRTLLAARLPFYEQADYRVAGDDDPASVVARILALPAFAKRLTNLGEELSARRVKP